MTATARRLARWLAAAGAIAFLAGPAAMPATARPVCEGACGSSPSTGVVVERVEVPVEVPVDDTGAEIAQLALAAAMGAAVAATVALRRRSQRGDSVSKPLAASAR